MNNCKIVGKLDKKKLDFITKKRPDFAKLIKSYDIVMWDDRIDHISKHRMNFSDIYDFDDYVEKIPEIINSPDYIGIRSKDNSLQFIKKYNDNILVAVRINTSGNLSFRTFYPVTDSQINNYIDKKTAWEFK